MRAWFPGLRSITEILAAVSLAVFCFVTPAKADERLWADLQSGGHVLLMRHAATNPGVGDPPQFRLDDCTTQRNLSAAGQMQAANIGRMLMAQGVTISTVLSSRWCRCLETARRAFGKATPFPALDSFFGDRSAQADAHRGAAVSLQRVRARLCLALEPQEARANARQADRVELRVPRLLPCEIPRPRRRVRRALCERDVVELPHQGAA